MKTEYVKKESRLKKLTTEHYHISIDMYTIILFGCFLVIQHQYNDTQHISNKELFNMNVH